MKKYHASVIVYNNYFLESNSYKKWYRIFFLTYRRRKRSSPLVLRPQMGPLY